MDNSSMLQYSGPVTVPSKKYGPRPEDPYEQLCWYTIPQPQTVHPCAPPSATSHITLPCNLACLQPLHVTASAHNISTLQFWESVWSALLIPLPLAHHLRGFFGDYVNCCSTRAELSPLNQQHLPDRCLYMSYMVQLVPNLTWILEIPSHVGGSVANSHLHLCTSHTFSNFQYHLKINLCFSKY